MYRTMKLKTLIAYFLALPAFLMLVQSCNKCTETGKITLGAANQYLKVTYVDTAGNNYINSIYNLPNVSVLFSDKGGKNGTFRPYSEDFSDGAFGPFEFTATPTPAKYTVFYDYWYVINKDTYGTDTFRVVFYPNVDECKEFWGEINYYKNGDLLPDFSGQEIVDLTITE